MEDTVWGTHELDSVDDKILIALLESPTVQRLKTVLQVGSHTNRILSHRLTSCSLLAWNIGSDGKES